MFPSRLFRNISHLNVVKITTILQSKYRDKSLQ